MEVLLNRGWECELLLTACALLAAAQQLRHHTHLRHLFATSERLANCYWQADQSRVAGCEVTAVLQNDK
jgi:hypothetical protein